MQSSDPPQKLGLALSGGGFRAAFFHVGVLARMAEMGILRRVEVISTVSGGSIVGALYYIHVRDLLETKTEPEIGDDDYVRIVEHVARSLLAGVETNLRGRTFRNLGRNFRMARRSYSRSERMGELYDETFYRKAWNEPLFGRPPAKPRQSMVQMRELRITPPGAPDSYNPTEDRRSHAPVPVLVVNATTLNTGHNWRFEAVGMGEPDRAPKDDPRPQEDPREDARREVDRNDRLSWTHYERLPRNKRNIEVGIAVAASSCVPSLFHPLPIVDLYRLEREGTDPQPVTVELVDGGVHDNQGVEGLIEFECSPIVVSDASGYLPDQQAPATRIPAVIGRTVGIYGDRVREEQLITTRLEERKRPMGLAHLRKGIVGHAILPLGDDGKPLGKPRREPPEDFRGERFDVAEDVQNALSRVRTDLDAFSEVEAYSLMLDGYRMAGPNLDLPELQKLGTPGEPRAWGFHRVGEAAKAGAPAEYMRHLAMAKSRFFKAPALSTEGKLLTAALVLVALVLIGLLLTIDGVRAFFAGSVPAWAILAGLGVLLFLVYLYMNDKVGRRFSDFLYTQVFVALMAIPLWLSSWLVLLFSRIFVRAGRVDRVLGPAKTEAAERAPVTEP